MSRIVLEYESVQSQAAAMEKLDQFALSVAVELATSTSDQWEPLPSEGRSQPTSV
ncbi:hypothetical protein FOQG_18760 [Fusarium oxysporum f. sp. raphani 54005]|uniref:Uncharacterized protein n=2 Tax=Fusarium oxysporum TaxID=5507 RepID=X0C126_FUSOX|nr:hypothetical protein FOVG_18637 [Fusarium oxysporum f. sp. pisi HDV247]EXK76497.1 hypothetical protein FOQG_18760 [Fusarium oxysporum f. sp. raphani 54005]